MTVARARASRRRERPDPSPLGPFLVMVAVLAALLGFTNLERGTSEVELGVPSPRTYLAPMDMEIVDEVATTARRAAARNQIPELTRVDDDVTQQVLARLVTLSQPLPADTLTYLMTRYGQPDGVRVGALFDVIDAAVRLAPSDRQREVRLVLEQHLGPTALVDERLTAAARNAAAADVDPVVRFVPAGEVLLARGAIVTEEALATLRQAGIYGPTPLQVRGIARVLLGVVLAALLLALPFAYAARRLAAYVTRRQFNFLVGVTVLAIVTQRIALELSPDLVIVVLVPLLVASLVDETLGMLWAAWLAVLMGLFAGQGTLDAAIVALVAGVAAARIAGRATNRLLLVTAAAASGAIGGVARIVVDLVNGNLVVVADVVAFATLVASAAFAGIVALALLPLAEGPFEFLTEFRLAELASPQSALLQRLVLQAPGTFQHSQIIANLVEQSVAQVGGNALLARVGALYHDVGKLRRPQFFVENQTGGENPHDKISPHLSFLIITAHVRDGVELLREHNLPPALEPFVTEHHGTTVLAYFYKRALEDTEHLSELNFRYAGPRPRTRETAVLMLADAVESASRTLAEPSQGAIRALIDRIFEQRLQDGQLADSPLTFRDLDVIASTFERVLTASLHRRVRYPTAEEIKGLQRGGDPRRDAALPSA